MISPSAIWTERAGWLWAHTYEHMAAWPTELAQANDTGITRRMNEKPKLVFPRTREKRGLDRQ